MRAWKGHVNNFGMLVQNDGTENGNDLDSPQRMGMFWAGCALREKQKDPYDFVWGVNDPHSTLSLLRCVASAGDYMRSPNPKSKGNYCDMMTRDQQTGIIATGVAGGLKRQIYKLMVFNLKRGWFTNNRTGWRVNRQRDPHLVGKSKPNFAGLSQLAMCFRAMGWWWMYLLTTVLDAELIFNAVKYRWFSKRREPINFILRCGIARYWHPTLTGWIANRINDPDNLHERLVRYMDRGPHQAPPLQNVWTLDMMKRFM